MRSSNSTRRARLLPRRSAFTLAALAAPLASTVAHAQVVLDGSLGAAGALQGPAFVVPDTAGQIRGSNLFHSFSQLSLAQGERVTFAGPNSVQNVLARVTGPNGSTIDGTLATSIPGANLVLINPRGITFGPNASLDVDGAFVATTADVVRLGAGPGDGRFDATDVGETVLTSAPPAAFGFLGTAAPGKITVNGATLAAGDGKAASLVGGDVEINGGRLQARSGRVNVVSVAAAGEVSLDPASTTAAVDVSAAPQRGTIRVSAGGKVDANGDLLAADAPGGSVVIRGGQLLMTGGDTEVTSDGQGARDNGPVDVAIDRELELVEGAAIGTISRSGTGRAGNVDVRAARLSIRRPAEGEGFSGISSISRGEGPGGNVTVNAETIELTGLPPGADPRAAPPGGANIGSITGGTGRSGDVTVIATQAVLMEGPTASVQTGTTSTAAAASAGTLTVVAPVVGLGRGAALFSNSQGAAASGPISIGAGELFLTGAGTTISGSTGGVAGGGIGIRAGNVTIDDNARVVADTIFAGDAGRILISADGAIRVRNGASVSSSTAVGTGNAAAVVLIAPTVELDTNGAVTSSTFGPGNAGFIRVGEDPDPEEPLTDRDVDESGTIVTGSLRLDGGATLTSETNGGGNAGTIEIFATDVEVLGGARIATGATTVPDFSALGGSNVGNAGGVGIVASGRLLVSGGTPFQPSTVESRVRLVGENVSAGDAGAILVAAGDVRVDGGAVVSTSIETGPETPGGPDLAATTGRAGGSGLLRLFASNTLVITGRGADGGPPTSVTAATTLKRAGASKGGDIGLLGRTIEVSDGARVSAVSTGSGDAGVINLVAQQDVLLARGAEVTASADLANAGDPTAPAVSIAAIRDIRLNRAAVTARALVGNGGSLDLRSARRIRLTDSRLVTQAGGTGGNIFVGNRDPDTGAINPFVILFDSSEINANAVAGNGGNISILSDEYVTSADTIVTATSEQSAPGEVDVSAAYTELAGGLVRLPSGFANSAAALKDLCGLRVQGEESSFIATGRGGTPLTPDGVQPSFDLPRPTR